MSYGSREGKGKNSGKGSNQNKVEPGYDKSSNPTTKTTKLREGEVKKTPMPDRKNRNEFGY